MNTQNPAGSSAAPGPAADGANAQNPAAGAEHTQPLSVQSGETRPMPPVPAPETTVIPVQAPRPQAEQDAPQQSTAAWAQTPQTPQTPAPYQPAPQPAAHQHVAPQPSPAVAHYAPSASRPQQTSQESPVNYQPQHQPVQNAAQNPVQDQNAQSPFYMNSSAEQAPAPAGAAPAKAKRGVFLPVATTAVLAAVLASVGTAAVTGQFSADDTNGTTKSSTFGSIGQSSDASVNVPVTSSTVTNPDWQAVTAAVAPSVVSIQVTTAEGSGEGSGIVIDGEGHILTNDHVVSGAVNDTVQVTLYDGRIYEATIVGLDPATDLAVVKLVDPPADLKSAVFANSDDVVVGEPVMAMGNPLGLANTATTGIVSAIDRPVNTGTTSDQTSVVTNAIQIDAAINPGNSGGPLFNASGEVIGITSSIASLSSGSGQSGSIGLGFAIPAKLAQNIGGQLIENGSAEHAFLGVSLADGTGTADGTTRQGAVVKSVSAGSPAEAAKLQVDDVIVAIDGAAVTGAESLTGFVRALPASSEVTLTVVRDGKALDVKVTLAAKTETVTGGSTDGSDGTDGSSDGSTDGSSGQQLPGQQMPGQGTRPGSDDPSNVPDFSDLLPGQNG